MSLLQAVDTLLHERSEGCVRFVKVKGHAIAADVRAGRARDEDKQGNDAADFLARKGASLHKVDGSYRSRDLGCAPANV